MTKKHEIPLGPTPPRRPESLRRTSSLRSHSYESFTGPYLMSGHARDIYSGDNLEEPQVISEEMLKLGVSGTRQFNSIEASRSYQYLDKLIEVPLGGKLRKAMTQAIPNEVEQSTLLHRLIDDTVGVSIVTNAAFDAWGLISGSEQTKEAAKQGFDKTGMCISFASGSPSLDENGQPIVDDILRTSQQVPLPNDDPYAWHHWQEVSGPNQMRLRRMDLWQEAGLLHVDVGFQDSAAFPDKEERLVFHEYRLQAAIEPINFVLESVDVMTGVLPFSECLKSPSTAKQLVGQSIVDFRRSVLAQLPGPAGCTHLNDILRSLQDVVAMSQILDKELAKAA